MKGYNTQMCIGRVYEKHMGNAQSTCTRTARDVYRSHAWELHETHTQVAAWGERLVFFKHVLQWIDFDLGTSRSQVQVSNLQIFILLWFLQPFAYAIIDLEKPKIDYMHPMRSRDREQSNPRFKIVDDQSTLFSFSDLDAFMWANLRIASNYFYFSLA